MSRSAEVPLLPLQPYSRARVVIEHVTPEIDCGRFPIKRAVGDWVSVTADIFADGHDLISAVLQYWRSSGRVVEDKRHEVPLRELVNDRWTGQFRVTTPGQYCYTLQAWIDRFASWRRDVMKKAEAGKASAVDLLVGAALIDETGSRAPEDEGHKFEDAAAALRKLDLESAQGEAVQRLNGILDENLTALMWKYSERRFATTYGMELTVTVDREKARCSAWYEMFPRSISPRPGEHGTFRDCEARLSYIAEMGFDVLYLPPIHPIGRVHRKGRNNNPVAEPGDPGSPWAIGSSEGGHKAVHPQLGSLEDFKSLMARAREHGIEIALDLAYQCAPDHPYVAEHPEWFRKLPDGSIQYAENPPKKYEDIYPFDFESEHWEPLWHELNTVVRFWVEQGVRIFRVDNPHTKAFRFWKWLISDIKAQFPDVLFLAEAFTRPKVMYRLAKLGFTHSYTYFAWRNTKREITEYFTELTQTQVSEYFRPHLWPNTPDILTENLQFGSRPVFAYRLVLAATLGANYGVYGPAYELGENRAIAPGREEYLDAEKYEIKRWDIDNPASLKELIRRVNYARRENAALQSDRNLRFQMVDNEALIAYTKATDDLSNVILVVVNLDPHYKQSGWVTLPLNELGLEGDQPYQVHDLLTDLRFLWHGPRNYVELNPHQFPAHIFRLRRRVRTERDFDYFM